MQSIHTTVIHPVEPQGVHLTKVKVLANDVVELWDFGGDGGNGFILVEGEGSVMHDGFIVVRRVLIGDEVIVVFVEVVLESCGEFYLYVKQPKNVQTLISFLTYSGAGGTWCHLVQPNVNVVISVCTGLFVVKSQSVQQLMFNHSLMVAACSQRQDLTILLVANAREAPDRRGSWLKTECPINTCHSNAACCCVSIGHTVEY